MSNDNIDYKKFGQIIRQLRGKRSQQVVCEALDISSPYYSNIENGLAHPGINVLVSIANFYGISLAETLGTGEYNYDIPEDVWAVFEKCPEDKFLEMFDVLKYAEDKLL